MRANLVSVNVERTPHGEQPPEAAPVEPRGAGSQLSKQKARCFHRAFAFQIRGDQLPTTAGLPFTPDFGSPMTAFQAICCRSFSRLAEVGSAASTRACRPTGLSRYMAAYQT